jgi:hypothetical protein
VTARVSTPVAVLGSVVAVGAGGWFVARAVLRAVPPAPLAEWSLVAVGMFITLAGWIVFGPLFRVTWDGLRTRRAMTWRTRAGFTLVWALFVWIGLLTVALVNATLLDVGAAGLPAGQVVPRGSELWSQSFETEAVSLLAGVPVLELPETLRWKAPLEYTDIYTGLAQLVFKVVVVSQLLTAAAVIWTRNPPDPKTAYVTRRVQALEIAQREGRDLDEVLEEIGPEELPPPR